MTTQTLSLDSEAVRELDLFLNEVAKLERNAPETNAVYVLECTQPYKDDKQMRETLRTRYDPDVVDTAVDYKYSPNRGYKYPSELDDAIFADEVYYVGETTSLDSRIRQHLVQGGATLTKNFPPHSIERVEWFESRNKALERESELLDELGNMGDLPGHISVPYHWQDESHGSKKLERIFRRDAREHFPTRNFSDQEALIFGQAIKYAEKQDGVLLSDEERIQELALERVEELRAKEPDKVIYVGGG